MFVEQLQLMTGQVKVNKDYLLKNKGRHHFHWCLRVFSVLFLVQALSACTLTSFVSESADKVPTNRLKYPDDPSQQDHWLDNANAWRFWDVASPDNQVLEWSFEENAIRVHFESNELLNLHAGRPHTVKVKIIQFSDVAGYKTLAASPGGLKTILVEDISVLPNSVYVKEVLLAPNNIMTIDIARQQDAKFVAVVVGYANLLTRDVSRLLPIPVTSIPPPEYQPSTFDQVTLGFFAETQEQVPNTVRPGRLKIKMNLGETKIESFSAQSY